MVQLGPDTTRDAGGAPSASASGYGAEDTRVRGFSPPTSPAPAAQPSATFPFLLVRGRVPARPAAATVELVKGSERAAPGWYRASLGNGVGVSLAAAGRNAGRS
jgi:hypothetical protein